jgi:YVTN family beta-propeller protein
VWVTDQLDDVVWRVDPARDSIVSAVKVGRDPQGVATGSGAVWVANTVDATLSEIDPVSNRVIATIPVGAGAQWVAVGDGSVWVTTHEGAPT